MRSHSYKNKEPRGEAAASFNSSIHTKQRAASDKGFLMLPHWFFRDFTPHANLTQIKIVGEIINQTVGWGKQYDNSTLGVLAKHIGASRDAVSRNIQPLIDAGIIALANEQYGILDTPEKRKQSGNAKLPTAFAINSSVVLTQDRLAILKKPVSRKRVTAQQDNSQTDSKATDHSAVSHYKINNPKDIKETVVPQIKTPHKFHKEFSQDRCSKCGKPVAGMMRMQSVWQFRRVLCADCKGGGDGMR